MEKKAHTLKTLILSTQSKLIKFISTCWVGRTHDFSVLKLEFPPDKDWFKDIHVKCDLGFLGFDKLYACKAVSIPHKRNQGKDLNEQQKQDNTIIAQQRVSIEHAIGGMKRFRILSERFRNKNFSLYDQILEVCAGLWNFYLLN